MSEVLGSKLSDKIRTEGLGMYTKRRPLTPLMTQTVRDIQNSINTSPVYFIQNVADYLQELTTRNREAALRLDAPNFPCIAPPYSRFFTEFRFRRGSQAHSYGLARGGVLFEEVTDIHQVTEAFSPEVIEQAKWVVAGTAIADYPETKPIVMTSHLFAIGENGALVPNSPIRSSVTSEYLAGEQFLDDEHRFDVIHSHYNGMVIPSLLAVTFTHCKGTVVREEIPPIKLSRQIERRTGHPLLRYRVIDVNPFQEVLRKEGQVERVGLPHALSTVSGHFADYRERGLFGREHLRGVYWKPDHERGDPSNGIIRKDYKSNIPQ